MPFNVAIEAMRVRDIIEKSRSNHRLLEEMYLRGEAPPEIYLCDIYAFIGAVHVLFEHSQAMGYGNECVVCDLLNEQIYSCYISLMPWNKRRWGRSALMHINHAFEIDFPLHSFGTFMAGRKIAQMITDKSQIDDVINRIYGE